MLIETRPFFLHGKQTSILLQKSWNDESETVHVRKNMFPLDGTQEFLFVKWNFSFLATPIYRVQLKDTEEVT